MSNTTNGSFTATGNSAAVRGDQVDVLLSGTFTATISLQVEDNGGNWIDVPDQSHSASVFSGSGSALARNWRLACTGFTSGEAVYELSAATATDRR
ncbi:MAG: hypothetical protein C0605_15905 [Hyphomicrobiales bacterium]|nr:MAG: hypothetical protein C0605_15905 [Hyphomicrobiales bacterium]